jgi:hypothetical protein
LPPSNLTVQEAIALILQDHEFFISSDPHLVKFEKLGDAEGDDVPTVPEAVATTGPTLRYKVVDLVHTLPAGLWDSNVVSTYEMTNTKDGVFVRIKSPMSVSMDTIWTIRQVQGAEANQLELVEDVNIYCSKLLVGTVKGLCEAGWSKIHAKMLQRITDQTKNKPAV